MAKVIQKESYKEVRMTEKKCVRFVCFLNHDPVRLLNETEKIANGSLKFDCGVDGKMASNLLAVSESFNNSLPLRHGLTLATLK